MAGVHGSGGTARRGARQDTVGAARVGRGSGVSQGGGENGCARRPVPVRRCGHGPAPGQGLLRGPVVADRPEPGRLRGCRDVRRTSGRQAASGGRRSRHRACLPVPDRAMWFGPVPGAAYVPGRYQVSFVLLYSIRTYYYYYNCRNYSVGWFVTVMATPVVPALKLKYL